MKKQNSAHQLVISSLTEALLILIEAKNSVTSLFLSYVKKQVYTVYHFVEIIANLFGLMHFTIYFCKYVKISILSKNKIL